MPEHIRALIYILLLAGTTFMLAKKPCSALVGEQIFKRWRITWFALTLAAFLAHNFWLYSAAAILILSMAAAREPNRSALFFLTLYIVPAASIDIPGLGLIDHLVSIDHIILLELAVLLPAYLMLRGRPGTLPFGRLAVDKLLAGYLALIFVLEFRDASITGGLRNAFYLFVNAFLPYYVISRSLRTLQDFRVAIAAFVLAILLLAPLGIFESAKHWLLYKSLLGALDLHWSYFGYLGRADLLRAQGSVGQPIAFAFLMVAGIGFMLYLQACMPSRLAGRAGLALMAGGLAASLSRGPWVAAALMITVFTATGRHAARHLLALFAFALLAFGLLAMLPGGQWVIDLLPWIGSVEKGSTEYRERVFDGSLVAIMRNPWFGATDFTKYPEMQALIQGDGIIDIVNTYLLIALKHGLVTLAFFAGFFALIVFGVFRQMRRLPDDQMEAKLLGRALFATLIGLLATIGTVSNITVISIVCWSVAALGVAYIRMIREMEPPAILKPAA